MSDKLSLGGLIRRQRAELGLTQARLAELVGKSPSTLRGWERDRTKPADPSSLAALAAVLGISDEELDSATREPTAADETELSLGEAVQLPVAPAPADVEEIEEPDPKASSPEDNAPFVDYREVDELLEESQEATDESGVTDPGVEPIEPPAVDALTVPETSEDDEVDASTPDSSSPEAIVSEIPEPVEDRRREKQAELPTAVTPARPRPEREESKPVVDHGISAVSARPRVPSYLDDPSEVRTYRVRVLVTVAVMVFLFVVLRWAFGEAGDALGSLFEGTGPELR